MNGGLDVIVMHGDNSPFIQPEMWRPLSSARREMRRKDDCNSLHNPAPSFCSGDGYGGYFRQCLQHTRHVKACTATKWREDAAGAALRHVSGEDTGNCESKALNKGLRVHASVDLSM